MNRGLDPPFDILDQVIARFLPGDEVQAFFAPQGRDIQPGALELILHPLVGLVMAQVDAGLSLRDPGNEEPDGGLEFPLGLPEAGHVVARRYGRVPETERNMAPALPRSVKTIVPEEAQDPLLLRAGRPLEPA